MPNTIKVKRGLEANRTSVTPAAGEFVYTTDQKRVYIGDGTTPGGNAVSVPDPGSLLRVTVFGSSGTWNKGENTRYVRAYGWGGGGGGGGGQNGGSGASGSYAEEFIDVTAVSSVAVTVGAGGNAGTPSVVGGTGGTSSFGAYFYAGGGTGGSYTTPFFGVGGTATGGDINIRGSVQGPAPNSGGFVWSTTGGTAMNGIAYGAPGFGADITNTNVNGGAGFAGGIIVEEYA